MSEKAHSSKDIESEDNGLSMVEVLEEEERLEADANAVLGDSDDKNCTYPLGYVNRQALYACNTCTLTENSSAAVCLACSYECHEGHDLIELYTKRFFRCDCGNSKFSELKCKLYPGKDKVNTSNKYNHNFKGLYCTCNKPYPDPDDDIDDEMIQCVICEDWFHGRHLGTSVPDNQNFSEVVCTDCMKKHDFLWAYNMMSPVTVLEKSDTTSDVDVTGGTAVDGKSNKSPRGKGPSSPGCSNEAMPPKGSPGKNTKGKSGSKRCLLKELKERKYKMPDHGAFWSDGWRKKLCHCEDCMKMYKEKEICFLTDDCDTVESYEERGRSKCEPVSQHAKEVNALSQMNRFQQIEIMQGFNDMKSQLSEYLKKFAENGKVVKEEDIKEFFSGMQARKRQKTNPGLQYNCK